MQTKQTHDSIPRPVTGRAASERFDITRGFHAHASITPREAELLVLESLEAALYPRAPRHVEHELLTNGEERLSAGAVEATLSRLAERGDTRDVSPFSWTRSFVITEQGRARLRGVRS